MFLNCRISLGQTMVVGQLSNELGKCITFVKCNFCNPILKMEKVAAYCGIDVSLKSHKICLLDSKQEIIRKFSILNNRDGLETLENGINKNTLICLEPTGVYSINIFIYLKKRGYNTRFCGTYSSRRFRESMFGKKKHDNLAEFLCDSVLNLGKNCLEVKGRILCLKFITKG